MRQLLRKMLTAIEAHPSANARMSDIDAAALRWIIADARRARHFAYAKIATVSGWVVAIISVAVRRTFNLDGALATYALTIIAIAATIWFFRLYAIAFNTAQRAMTNTPEETTPNA